MKNKDNIDKGSLTPEEYEYIKHILSEYIRCIDNVNEPDYLRQIRVAKKSKILEIVDKMEARMKEFPNSFV